MASQQDHAFQGIHPFGSRALIATVYLAGLLQGFTLISIPASSAILKVLLGLTDAQYGSVFLPLVVLAVLSSLWGPALIRRTSLKNVFCLTLLANALSQILIIASILLPSPFNYPLILLANGCLGLAYGFSGVPLNSLPGRFFPRYPDSALVAMHTFTGAGLALGPLLAGWLMMHNQWSLFPKLLLGWSVLLLIAGLLLPMPEEKPAAKTVSETEKPALHPVRSLCFWLYVVILIAYAFAEGTFSNWGVIYLRDEKQLPMMAAAQALSVFWAAIAVGRFIIAGVVVKVPAAVVWRLLPVLTALAFVLLPHAHTPRSALAVFALAGFSCSGFFPLTVGMVARQFHPHAHWAMSLIMAASMLGSGLGTFIIGPLRSLLSLENIYRFSIVYPLLVILLSGVLWLRMRHLSLSQAKADLPTPVETQ